MSYESCISSLAEAEESSPTSSSGTESSEPSSGSPRRSKSSRRASRMEACLPSRSSETCALLWNEATPETIAAWLTASLAASPANPSPSPEPGDPTKTSATWRRPSSMSFGRFSPDGSSLRTSQVCLLLTAETGTPTFEPFSGDWPAWGLMLGGECWALTMPELPTAGSDSGSWPTPSAMNPNDGQDAATYEARRRRLQEAHGNGNGAGLVLAQAVQRTAWPTATATATAGDAIGAGNRNLPGSKAHAGTSLTDAVNGGQAPRRESWATPNAGDDRGPSAGLEAARARHAANGVNKQVGLRDQVPRDEGQISGALNPDWVACLMGWPVGWEDASRPLPQPVTFLPWPAPPGPQHPWEPPRLAPRVPGRTARLRMLGNGQVPATAVLAWRVLGGGA